MTRVSGRASALTPTSPHLLLLPSLQRSVRRRAHYLDKGFSICGFRFGWTAILGLIPCVHLFPNPPSYPSSAR